MFGTDGPPDSQERAQPRGARFPTELAMDTSTGSAGHVDENARRQFEQAWGQGRPGPIEQFLPPQVSPSYLETLEELVHIELEMAWKARAQNPTQVGDTDRVSPGDVDRSAHNLPSPVSAGGATKGPCVEDYLARFAR